MRFRFPLTVLTAIVGTALLGAAPAWGNAPVNDRFGDRIHIASNALPSTQTQDTTGATTQQSDPASTCGFNPQATVWFAYRPTASQLLQADTLGSDYDTTLVVLTGSPTAGFTEVACNDDPGALRFQAVAGTTYSFMVGQCCGGEEGGGGNLIFHLGPPPAPPTIKIAVTAGTLHRTTGLVTLSGTMRCRASSPTAGNGSVTLRQIKDGFLARGSAEFSAACDGKANAWSTTVESETFRAFTKGAATATADAYVCDTLDCTQAVQVTKRLLLGG